MELTLDENWLTQNKPCLVISSDDGASSDSSTHQASWPSASAVTVCLMTVHPAVGSALCRGLIHVQADAVQVAWSRAAVLSGLSWRVCLQALQRSGLLSAQPQVQFLKVVPRTLADVLDSILQVHTPPKPFTIKVASSASCFTRNPLS